MKQTTHTRKGKQIIDLTTGVVEDFKSVNQAKYRSRAIQMAADNALIQLTGIGVVKINGTLGIGVAPLAGARMTLEGTLNVTTIDFENRYLTKDGDFRTISWTGTPLPSEGLMLLMGRDISLVRKSEEEREALEEQLRQSQKIEAIGRLAGGIAHDFNNLLTVINTYAGFGIEALKENDPLRDDLLQILEAGERATTLTRQLLAFGRKQMLKLEVVSLNDVIGGLETMLRRLIGEDIQLLIAPAEDLGAVKADPAQIEQVLMNLVVNARDAMPQGGGLTIETLNADLGEEYAEDHLLVQAGRYVMFAVSDTGIGMDEATCGQAFEPFFTTKEEGKGTGLGLSTVYGIVKQSGGNISVDSEPGKGTTFKIYLPRVEADETRPIVRRSARPAARSTGGETVLVVEDDDVVRNVAARILDSAGFRTMTAANGGEALLLCEQELGKVDLLLTDVVMPRMSGKRLAERLKEICPGMRVLFMSGYTDNAIVHHGVLDSETEFISKPFTAVDLTDKVREVLSE